MKKIIGLFILLALLSCSNPPQDSVMLKIQFKPGTKYRQTTERTSQTVIKYDGSAISLQRLRARGIQNPTITSKKFLKESTLTAGKSTDGINFPFTVEVVKAESNDGKKDLSEGAVFHGLCSTGKMPIFESVTSDELDSKSKVALLQTLQNSFSQLSFPEKKLKIGEQFSVEYPLSIPMEGSTIEMVVTNQYKLVRISNSMADFDVSQLYVMSPTVLNNSFKGTGTGKGQLIYDMANHIVLKNTLDTEIEINKKLDSFEFNLKTKGGFIQSTSIETNN